MDECGIDRARIGMIKDNKNKSSDCLFNYLAVFEAAKHRTRIQHLGRKRKKQKAKRKSYRKKMVGRWKELNECSLGEANVPKYNAEVDALR